MNRQQLSLVVLLGLIGFSPAFAAGPSDQGGGWRSSSDEAASSTLSGKLYRNSADSSGSAPYIVLDRWGVVRGYVTAAQGVELESCVGQQVSLQGRIKTLPGGDMPHMTCQRVLGGNAESTGGQVERALAPRRHEAFTPVARDQQPQEIAPQPGLPTRTDMAADPAPRSAALPLHEVVLEPRMLPTSDDSQDQSKVPSAHQADPRRARRQVVQAANYQEMVPTPVPAGAMRHPVMTTDPALEPSPIEEGPMVSSGPMVSDGPFAGSGPGGCDSCDEGSCGGLCNNDCVDDPCWGPRRPLFCWGPTGIWVKAEYLQWWERGSYAPPLVTTGPNAANPGYIGTPGTSVLFGGQDINNKSEAGGRIQAGLWLNPCLTFGFEGEYFALADQNTDYYRWSDGNPILSRPFYDVGKTTPVENVELVAFPRGSASSLDGAINIGATTRFHGAGAHFLFTLCRQEGCWTDECDTCNTYHDRFRAILTAGYRYLDLEDQLGITETLTTTSPTPVDPTNPTGAQGVSAFLINDQFNTQNTFNGADIGTKFEFARNRWSLDLFPRIAFGSTHSVADINGSTRTTSPAGVETTSTGGLLALSTNIGHYTQDNFAVVPEIDMNIGFQVTPHTKLVFGYDFLYWSKVARASEQIDRGVNSTLLPNSGVAPIGDTTRPAFSFQENGFWAQGIKVGVDCRW